MKAPEKRCAVLIAGSPADVTGQTLIAEETPIHLTPLIGKTPLIFAIQSLVEAGITEITCIGWDEPQQCQAQLQTGLQWGCIIKWHSISSPEQAFARLEDLAPIEPFILATTCSIFNLQKEKLDRPGSLIVSEKTEGSDEISPWPWAWLDRSHCKLLGDAFQWKEWPQALAACCSNTQKVNALNLIDGQAILKAIPIILEKSFPVVLDASEVEPGIFISRNVIIHPTAEIIAPFYAGQDVEIEKNCQIGPAVAIGKRTRIGHNTHLSKTQIGNNSWIGDSLDIHECIVCHGIIWSQKYQTNMTIHDALILAQGNKDWKWNKFTYTITKRMTILILYIFITPILVATAIYSIANNYKLKKIELIQPDKSHLALPTVSYISWLRANPSSQGWKHILGFVLPNLINIVKGQCNLTGTRPRNAEEWKNLTPEYQNWLRKTKPGLIQEEWMQENSKNDLIHTMIMERYQQNFSKNLMYKIKLISRYLKKIISQNSIREKHRNSI